MNDSSKHILIVEDETELAQLLKDYLIHAHFKVSIIQDGGKAQSFIESNSLDLVLLDIMLPNVDGYQICKFINQAYPSLPVIMMTAKVEEIDRLLGLELGADDYICKPYSPREVVARVKAIFRRLDKIELADKQDSQFVEVDETSMSVVIKKQRLNLTNVEFKLFLTMYKNPMRIYSREQLMDLIYSDYRIVSQRTIDSHIKKLRKKVNTAEIGVEYSLIHSVYGVGYKYEEIF